MAVLYESIESIKNYSSSFPIRGAIGLERLSYLREHPTLDLLAVRDKLAKAPCGAPFAFLGMPNSTSADTPKDLLAHLRPIPQLPSAEAFAAKNMPYPKNGKIPLVGDITKPAKEGGYAVSAKVRAHLKKALRKSLDWYTGLAYKTNNLLEAVPEQERRDGQVRYKCSVGDFVGLLGETVWGGDVLKEYGELTTWKEEMGDLATTLEMWLIYHERRNADDRWVKLKTLG